MKKTLLYCLLLLLIGCKSNESEDNPPVLDCDTYLPASYSNNWGNTVETYHYDGKGRIEKIEYKQDSKISRLILMEYDNQGNVIKMKHLAPDGKEMDRKTYEYNTSGQLIKSNHYVIFNGSPDLQYFTTYEYNSNKELKKVSHHQPGFPQSEVVYEYQNGIMKKVFYYHSSGEVETTVAYEYDDKKGFLSGAPYSLHVVLGIGTAGFPYQHNIKKQTITHLDGRVEEEPTGTYEYNEAGYPIKFMPFNSGGSEIRTYTYKCK
ncbi:hypothetical protein ACFS7Z_21785 [Pontibacter toksunensis]|uniref:YD repeat-containing protein n=1 Tax=Pontibacter toksunensis TaxID=1332631 RepID=A0ABW6C1D1_9BACT